MIYNGIFLALPSKSKFTIEREDIEEWVAFNLRMRTLFHTNFFDVIHEFIS